MGNLEPFNYIMSTNIKEHNQFVEKINEIIGEVNKLDPNDYQSLNAKLDKVIYYIGKDTDLIPTYPF
nr:MAG TPA: hypothetical protein [Caudoviricetes sp.]